MKQFKITYSVLEADLDDIHREFDAALAALRDNLGQEFPSIINGKDYKSGKFIENRNPSNTTELLGKFHTVSPDKLDEVFSAAKLSQKCWGLTPWEKRVELINKAADLISERRTELAAIMTLECGKNRLECLGDVEEAADLLRYYAKQLVDANGFIQPMNRLSPNEATKDIFRPFGVFVVIAPFNFPSALAAGMTAGALLGGNAAILKPSQETPWSAFKLYECLRDAGIPEGVFQLVFGDGSELGKALVDHPHADGVAFTGSYDVGMKIFKSFSKEYPKPCLLEMGGKNAAVVCESADLDIAAEGCFKSFTGASGQKCSALSRIYIHPDRKEEFLKKLIAHAEKAVIGDPTLRETFLGPVITEAAVKRHLAAIKEANKSGTIRYGGNDIRKREDLIKGNFVQPTIVEVPKDSRLFFEEFFTPFVAIQTVESIEEAVAEINKATFGLTGGLFTKDKEETDYFLNNVEVGVIYVNRKAGATTGAWPGVQPFCGWKGSGSTGKGGCGPYYAQQFMREQSHTIVE